MEITETPKRGRPENPDKHILSKDWSDLSVKKKIRKIIIVLKKSIKKNYKNNKIKLILLSYLLLIIIITPISINIGRKININHFTSIKYTWMEKINVSRQSYTKYKNYKPYDLHMQWINFLKLYSYKRGGDPIMNQADCLRALYLFLKSRGSNFEIAGIDVLARNYKMLIATGHVNLARVPVTGDIIIFKPKFYENDGYIYHIGLVEETRDGYVKYMDFTPFGVGFPMCKISDYKIQMIVEMNFFIWAGNLLKE